MEKNGLGDPRGKCLEKGWDTLPKTNISPKNGVVQ